MKEARPRHAPAGAPTLPTLTGRRQAILKAIVQEYISTVRPVASETIARNYALGVSSATIRNEMVALEEMGYIHQLHTSAGRVPSEEGYRFYVEHLMEETALTSDEQRTIVHQFHQANVDLSQWLRLAAAILAKSVRSAAVVTAPRAQQARFKHLELISIQESLALLVAVFDGGVVQQEMFVPAAPAGQADLSAIAGRVNRMLEGSALAPLFDADPEAQAHAMTPEGAIELQVIELIARMMRGLDEQANADVFVDGLEEILSQPEFSFSARHGAYGGESGGLHVVQLMQQGILFNELIRQLSDMEGLQIIIGGHGGREEMRQISLVMSRYGSPAVGGLLGVLGPMRMQYGRAVSVVRYVSGILGEMATELGGH